MHLPVLVLLAGNNWLRLMWATPTGPAVRPSSRTVCPHCTNLDTLSRHCADDRCGWASCSCGALLYSDRRHRHPRHGSDHDTCHDSVAAV